MGVLPSHIGPYRVLGSLGGGGFAEVLLGEDTRPARDGERVALKRVRPDLLGRDPLYRRSLVSEGRLARQLSAPNMVRVDGLLSEDGAPVMVMEYIEGFGLDALLGHVARQGLPPSWVGEIGCQIGRALAALHTAPGFDGRGWVHQDLKPSNIRITPDGVVKVLDLGIAVPAGQALKRVRQGTPGYRSPEQGEGALSLTPASDIYALGILLWEMARGRRLFPENVCHDPERLASRQAEVLAELHHHPEVLPPGLAPLVGRMLARTPELRPPTAVEALALLDAWRRGAGSPAAMPGWCRSMASVLGGAPPLGSVAARADGAAETSAQTSADASEVAPTQSGEGEIDLELTLDPEDAVSRLPVLDEAPPAAAPSPRQGVSAAERRAIWGAAAVLGLAFWVGLQTGRTAEPQTFGAGGSLPDEPVSVTSALEVEPTALVRSVPEGVEVRLGEDVIGRTPLRVSVEDARRDGVALRDPVRGAWVHLPADLEPGEGVWDLTTVTTAAPAPR